jgi:hypothetical protein
MVQLDTLPLLEHSISGDALCLLDAEGLKAIGVSTVGQRLSILKAIYNAKLDHNIPIDSDHYVPPCKRLPSKKKGYSTHFHQS